MAVNELVLSRANEHVSRKNKETMCNGFRMFRNVRADRGVKRGPRTENPNPTVKVDGRKPGRPRLYGDEEYEFLAPYLVKHGLTKAQKALEAEGCKVSLTVLRAVAKAKGIEFPKGRPVKAA